MGYTERLEKNIPPEIKSLRRFVLWRHEDSKTGKPTKIPYHNIGKKAASNNPASWNSFAGVMELYKCNQDYFSGVGVVLGEGLVGIDPDHALSAEGIL